MYIEKLSNAHGVSGNEKEVRDLLVESLRENKLESRFDSIGNLFVRSPGKRPGAMPRIMICAHMDEVGLMVTHIESSGHLRFKKVGSIDDRVLVSKMVRVGNKKLPGVIGSKPIHLQKPDERKKPLQVEDMYIDIGVKDKDDAEKHIAVGDYVSFDSVFQNAAGDCFIGKAFDDRAGCALLLELLQLEKVPGFDAAFTVQEEIGARGAQVAAYALEPEIALVIETTSASDVPETIEHSYATSLGKGPALTVMDSSVLADRELLQKLIEQARNSEIPFQFRRFTGGGTDAGPISVSRGGVRTAVISVPCRYIHSPFSIIKKSDWINTLKLIEQFLISFEE